MPPIHVSCSRLLNLDLDGVLHRASDSIHFAQSPNAPPVPVPVLAVQLKAQRRLVWQPRLEEALAGDPGIAILVHSTWRRRLSMPVIAELLGPLRDRVIVPPSYQIDMGAPAPEFIRASLEWINEERVQSRATALTLQDLLLVDDRLEFFESDPELRARLLLTNPEVGLSDPIAFGHLKAWAEGHWSPEDAFTADGAHDDLDAASAPTPPSCR